MNNAPHWLLTYLLNSIWQVAVIAVSSVIATRLMTPASWRARYLLAIAALLLAVLLPAWSAATSTPKSGESVAVTILSSETNPRAATSTMRSRTPHRYSSALHLTPTVSKTVAFLYLAFLLYRAGALVWKWQATQRLLRHATNIELPGDAGSQWQRLKVSFQLEDVRLLASSEITGPVTLGVHSAALLVPPDFVATATREEVAAALCHELAHIARRDFLVNLLVEIASLPISFHPACWLLKRQIDESRELLCDAMAARASTGSEVYARSLLSLAQTICAAPGASPTAPLTNALGIFEANILEKRIMNLINRQPTSTRAAKLFSITIACSVLAATCIGISLFTLQPATAQTGSDLKPYLGTWKTTVNGQSAAIVQLMEYQGKLTGSVSNGDFGVDEKNNNAITGWKYGTPGGAPIVEASVSGRTLSFKTLDTSGTVAWDLTLTGADKAQLQIAEAMPNGSKLPPIEAERIDSTPAKDETPHENAAPRLLFPVTVTSPRVLYSVEPQYTPEARAAKFSGKCIVTLTVDTNGNPINVRVEKPIGMGLAENAVKAVRQYRFVPAMQNGVPVAKQVHIEVNFQYF